MNDLISRQKAIEFLGEEPEVWCGDTGEYAVREQWRADVSAIKAVPSAEPERHGRWIPCSERLPDKEKKTYWICTDTEQQCECRWTNNVYGFGESDRWGWSIFDIPYYTKVSAWMPLPEPYKDGEQE